LIHALSEVKRLGIQVTDDTAACELIGQSVVLVEGRWPNPKVTTPDDLPYVDLLLQQEARV
jgi:2-C-methyl-D-erythritol 4-phosphate cytidylyltransferase